MSAVSRVRWFDAINLVIGLWIFVSPWVISETSASPVAPSMHISGALAALLAGYALMRSGDLAEYGVISVGLWLIVSPWVLDFDSTVTRQAIFYGVVIVSCAGFSLQRQRRG